MSKLFDSIPEDLLYNEDATDGLNLCGNSNRPLVDFALVDKRCVTSTLLSLLLRYSPDQIRCHLFTMSSSSELLRCIRAVDLHCKGRDTMESLLAAKTEGEHFFMQISSITKVSTIHGLVQGLRNFYNETVVPTVATMTTLSERRTMSARGNVKNTTYEEVEQSLYMQLGMSSASMRREVLFIELDDIPFGAIDTKSMKRVLDVLYHLREYAGINVILITSLGSHLVGLGMWSRIKQVIDVTDKKDYVQVTDGSRIYKYYLPYAEHDDIIACYVANNTLCSKYFVRE